MEFSAESKAERTRRFIIEKVAPVFNRKGYTATSLNDLTKATGLSKGSIYGNFDNKDEVALAAFEYNIEFINTNLKKAVADAVTFREKLLAYPKTFREIYGKVIAGGGCPIVNTAVDSSELHGPLQRRVREEILRWKQALITIIDKGMRQREFSSYIDSEQTAMVMICLTEGGYSMSRATGDNTFFESALAEMEIIINAL